MDKKIRALEERAKRMKVDYMLLADFVLEDNLSVFFNYSFVKQHSIAPVKIEGETLTVAMDNPADLYLLEQLELRAKKKIRPVLSTMEDINTAINFLYSEITAENIIIPGLQESDFKQIISIIHPDTVEWLKEMLVVALKKEATDIHIEPYENYLKLRYRIDGVIAETSNLPKDMESQINNLIKGLSGMKLEKRFTAQEGFFKVNLWQREIIIRVGSLPTRIGERFILRILDERQFIKSLDELSINPSELEILKNNLTDRHGLVLVSGPSGNGISTTLYSLVKHVAGPEHNIITIEDPIESPVDGINQMEVNGKMGMDYEKCMESALKHYPDVLMISRIISPESIHLAIDAALRGHLVISGLYSKNSLNTITHLVDMGIEPYLISSSLILIISQRMARRVCEYCAESAEPADDLVSDLNKYGINPPYTFRVGKGCSQCNQTGYRGRIGIYEIMPVTETIKSLIAQRSDKNIIQAQAVQEGFNSLYRNGLEKTATGTTTFEEIKRILMD